MKEHGAFVGKGLAALVAVAALVVVAAPAAWAQATFAPKVDYGVGNLPRSVAAADLDGDGDQDLATANRNTNNVSVLLNDGDGAFAPKAGYGAGEFPVSVAAADLDGDGDQDLATANATTDNISVLLNNGDGAFAPKADYGAGDLPSSVAAADLDGDGDQDLAADNVGSDNVSVLINDGFGAFPLKTDFGAGVGPFSVAAADLDSDGDQDLAAANFFSDNVSVLINDGFDAFAPKTDFGVGAGPVSVAAADLDGDGDPDLAIANGNSDNVSILINTTPRADLAITKSDSADPALVGEDLTYTLTVTNDGPATATNTVLTDGLPSGLSFVSATPSRGTCSESGGGVSCSLGNLASGATATVGIVVEPTATASPGVSNTARVESDRADFDRTDNSATETTAINRAPVAIDDAYTTDEDHTLRVPAPGVLGNDSDPDGETLTPTVLTDPGHGTLFLRSNGSFAYFPEEGYSGPDSFTYQVSDGRGGADTATVMLTVSAVNDDPAASDDSYTIKGKTLTVPAADGVLKNDSDPNGDALTATLASGPSKGTLTLNPDGSFTYKGKVGKKKPVTFVYEVSDGNSGTGRATVTISKARK